MRTLLMVAMALVATPAMAADQFDLVCKGRQRTSPTGRWRPYEQRYRVDLGSKTYCWFSCKSTEGIKSVDAARIEFGGSDSSDPGNVTLIHYVDRVTGKWVYFFSGGSGSFENTEGTCEPASFSGLPVAKF